MGKTFIIYYKVHTTTSVQNDVALVRAKDESNAIKNLKSYLDTRVRGITSVDILLIKEYRGLIFTRNHGQDD